MENWPIYLKKITLDLIDIISDHRLKLYSINSYLIKGSHTKLPRNHYIGVHQVHQVSPNIKGVPTTTSRCKMIDIVHLIDAYPPQS